jgi:hypothetical protein
MVIGKNIIHNIPEQCVSAADPGRCAAHGVGLRPLACWDYGFESRRRYGFLSLVSVVCCQTVSASSRSLFQRSPTECICARLSVISKPRQCGRPGPLGLSSHEKRKVYFFTVQNYVGYSVFQPCANYPERVCVNAVTCMRHAVSGLQLFRKEATWSHRGPPAISRDGTSVSLQTSY